MPAPKKVKAKGNGSEGIAVKINPIKMVTLKMQIVGTSPYVQHRFSQKAQAKMIADQKAGSTGKGKKIRTPKDFDQEYKNAMYLSDEKWSGIPAPAFRNAMISACRVVGFKMTHAKLAVFVEPDGFDKEDGTPLVRIHGTPKPHTSPARNDNGKMDIRCRPMWREGWKAAVRVTFDSDMFTSDDVFNLLKRAGLQVGVGEGRPDSRMSAGIGWGTFDIVSEKEEPVNA